MRYLSFLALVFLVGSCTTETEDPAKSEIVVSESTITSTSKSGSIELEINTKGDWNIANETDWIHFSLTSGKGASSTLMTWENNTEKNERTAKVTFYTSEDQFVISITQKGNDLELISYKGKSGNDKLSSDKFLLFNKPVTLINLEDEEEGIKFTQEDVKKIKDGYGFSFKDNKNELGRKNKYTFEVKDNEGNTLTGEVDIRNYSAEINFKGEIVQHFQHLDSTIFVLTKNSSFTSGANKIFILSDKLDIINEIELNNAPRKLCYNSFNDKFYLIYSDIDRIDIFDNDLEKSAEILINREDFDIPAKPIVTPISLGFNQSGKGIILFVANGNEQYVWRFIDSAKDHQISSAEKSENQYNSAKFINAISNYDHSKLFLLESGNYKIMKTINNEGEFKELEFSGEGKNNVIFGGVRPNRINDQIHVCGIYNQFIYDLQSGGSSTYHTMSHTVVADFCYLEEKESTVYIIDKMTAEFRVFDYKLGKQILSHPVYKPIIDFGEHVDFFTTINGEKIILSTPLGSEGKESNLITFNKEMFFE